MYITKKFLFCLLFLFVPLLGCLTPPSPPVAASWSDQLAAVERAIPAMNDDFIPVESVAWPVSCERGAADEPIELRVKLYVQNQKSSQVDEHGNSVYLTRDVHYNDHRLATTMEVDDDWDLSPRHPEDPASLERGRSIRFSPHDVLLLTLEEGQAFLDRPVDCNNLRLGLIGMWRAGSSEEEAVALWASSPELNAHALWEIRYARGHSDLIFLVDAHTGAILKRWER